MTGSFKKLQPLPNYSNFAPSLIIRIQKIVIRYGKYIGYQPWPYHQNRWQPV